MKVLYSILNRSVYIESPIIPILWFCDEQRASNVP